MIRSVMLSFKWSSKLPVRSNIFQRLVAEIHHDLGPVWRVDVKRDALKKLSCEEGVGAAFSVNLNGQVFLKTK